jgi:hypothetical protein
MVSASLKSYEKEAALLRQAMSEPTLNDAIRFERAGLLAQEQEPEQVTASQGERKSLRDRG